MLWLCVMYEIYWALHWDWHWVWVLPILSHSTLCVLFPKDMDDHAPHLESPAAKSSSSTSSSSSSSSSASAGGGGGGGGNLMGSHTISRQDVIARLLPHVKAEWTSVLGFILVRSFFLVESSQERWGCCASVMSWFVSVAGSVLCSCFFFGFWFWFYILSCNVPKYQTELNN